MKEIGCKWAAKKKQWFYRPDEHKSYWNREEHTIEEIRAKYGTVPLIYVGDKNVKAVEGGKLSDIAPTMLSLMGMEIPQEMTGKPLFIVE
ncbi:hypothetical protein A9X40_18610 [Escherichia coli]|nr:hypothetical protein A9X40_18610 [Escherichia coli]